MKPVIFFCVLMMFIMPFPAQAQAQTPAPSRGAQDELRKDGATYEKRLALAGQMHEIRPARMQVEEAVESAAARLPPLDRESFRNEILGAFDFDRLEELSIKAMAEIFTTGELEAMVAYYGSAEAQSVSEKMPVYEDMMQPEIMKMLDKALIRLRTGR